ncbi:MAG: hypothetical protein ABS79_01990 [Planctomycetes bacterium SCN 63-9]|nr:MAG: hypothetical protein ABS79_01990 [Planctomycetes bacterium SCN 63-9]
MIVSDRAIDPVAGRDHPIRPRFELPRTPSKKVVSPRRSPHGPVHAPRSDEALDGTARDCKSPARGMSTSMMATDRTSNERGKRSGDSTPGSG